MPVRKYTRIKGEKTSKMKQRKTLVTHREYVKVMFSSTSLEKNKTDMTGRIG